MELAYSQAFIVVTMIQSPPVTKFTKFSRIKNVIPVGNAGGRGVGS